MGKFNLKEAIIVRKPFEEVEEIIKEQISKMSEEYDLDKYDIAQIRLDAYLLAGWSEDPFAEEDADDDSDEEEYVYRSMSDRLAEIGMKEADFF